VKSADRESSGTSKRTAWPMDAIGLAEVGAKHSLSPGSAKVDLHPSERTQRWNWLSLAVATMKGAHGGTLWGRRPRRASVPARINPFRGQQKRAAIANALMQGTRLRRWLAEQRASAREAPHSSCQIGLRTPVHVTRTD